MVKEIKTTPLKATELKATPLKATELKATPLKATDFTIKRIRDHAPYRKSIALTEEDIQRLSYMESAFSRRYPLEVPFSFSKTISKAIELAYMQILSPNTQSMQQSLTGQPADAGALQDRQDRRQQILGSPNNAKNTRIGKFQKRK